MHKRVFLTSIIKTRKKTGSIVDPEIAIAATFGALNPILVADLALYGKFMA